jgi:hypothetical protein
MFTFAVGLLLAYTAGIVSDISLFVSALIRLPILSPSHVYIIYCRPFAVPPGLISILQYKSPYQWLLWFAVWCVFLLHFVSLVSVASELSCSRIIPIRKWKTNLSRRLIKITIAHIDVCLALLSILAILPSLCSGRIGPYYILLACHASAVFSL